MFGIKKLKRRISELEISRTEWMKIVKTGLEEIKTLKDENAKLKLDDERWRTQTESLVKEIESRDNTIKTLESEIERLTRKRDANGRFVKSVPIKQGFEVGDKVRIKDGVSSKTHWDIGPDFLIEMDKFIGDVLEIDEILRKGSVMIDGYAFLPDWLEHAD